jgi:GT2 family glycosyltransferase
MKPCVDVVVLSWNRLADTLECLDSVLSQKGVEVELWVVDQGSQPECLEALRRRCENRRAIHLLEAGRNRGVPAGRNLGMRAGRAATIVAIDNDAVFSDEHVLRRAHDRFSREPGLGALGFAIYDYHTGGPDAGCWGYPYPLPDYFDRTFSTARFCGAGHAIARQAFERTSGYDERLFFFGEELDLAFQLVELGYTPTYDPAIGVRHKSSGEGRLHWSSGRFYYNVRNMLYLNHKFFRDRLGTLKYAAGYLAKGLWNGEMLAACKGIKAGLDLIRESPFGPPLGPAARSYIERHELGPRGGLARRLLAEVLIKMAETLPPAAK